MAIGTISLLVGAVLLFKTVRFDSVAEPVVGEVLAQNGSRRRPSAAVLYTVAEEEYTASVRVYLPVAKGEPIALRYDPDSPADVLVADGTWRPLGAPLLLLMFGAGVFLQGVNARTEEPRG